MDKKEFAALQQLWDQKLAESGFKDIESKTSGYYLQSIRWQNRDEYFQLIGQKAFDENTVYKKETHRFVLTRHAEGAANKTIVQELADRGTPLDRMTVTRMIKRYAIAWKIFRQLKSQPTQ